MTQSRTHSALESLCNVLSGLLIANLTWLFVIAPLYGFTNPQHEVLAINLIFTVVSFIRGFLWRRLFNWLHVRGRERPDCPLRAAQAEERSRAAEFKDKFKQRRTVSSAGFPMDMERD